MMHIPTVLSAPGLMGKKIHKLKGNSQESISELVRSIISFNPILREPFYILDLGTVVDLHRRWNQHLPFVKPFYAVKCNPDPALIGTLAALGAGFDCTSRAEIEAVLSLGVAPDCIIYANPCKCDSHVRYAESVRVNIATFDSVYELRKQSCHHPRCSLLLRIKPPRDDGVRQSLSSKYGALPEEIPDLLRAAWAMNLSVVGVSFHVGTYVTANETFDTAIQSARAVFDLADELGGPKMHTLDIGGGFVAGSLFEEAGSVIRSSVERHFGDWNGTAEGLRVIAEPGRYFVETALTLATCVIGKRVRGEIREYWINDGVYGSMSRVHADDIEVPLLPLRGVTEGTKTYTSTVFGPTADSLDVVSFGIQLPEMEVGEWMVSPEMGAYAKTMGTSFNGFSTEAIPVHLAATMESVTNFTLSS